MSTVDNAQSKNIKNNMIFIYKNGINNIIQYENIKICMETQKNYKTLKNLSLEFICNVAVISIFTVNYCR